MAPHSSILAWKISWMEEPGELQSMGSLRVRHDWVTSWLHFPALEKEMATQSSVLAWRIPETGEPGGLLSMGSHRVGHDWSGLAAAAAVQGRGPISCFLNIWISNHTSIICRIDYPFSIDLPLHFNWGFIIRHERKRFYQNLKRYMDPIVHYSTAHNS